MGRATPDALTVETYQQRLVLQWALSNGLPKNNVDCTLEPIANLEPGKALIRNDSVWNFCTPAAPMML
jgi:hypothetical protein